MKLNIGFISFRLAGTDGVSLETAKWAKVLENAGHECYYFGGEMDTPHEHTHVVELAHFKHPKIKEIYNDCYYLTRRPPSLTREIYRIKESLKNELYAFIKNFNLHMLVPQNAITIPLNIPFGVAITELIAETGIETIAHHHDFFWERKRFLTNCVWDYINMCYPPHLPSIRHVVINSSAANQLALRTGISSVLIPNVMDFGNPPPPPDEYSMDVRQALGIKKDEYLILQPTRVVQRKGIEHAIELVARLRMNAAFVISHASGDEGHEYEERVKDYASLMGIRAIFVNDIIGEQRGTTVDGRKIYTLQDIYPFADFVTYPSLFEGFGNAFLETVYFKKPILVNNYSIYSHDIKPKGFEVVEMDDFISSSTVEKVRDILTHPEKYISILDRNYELGRKYYSFETLKSHLCSIMTSFWGQSACGVQHE
ncbi:MAG: glycosyltransferase family 4 protein [Spirochaetales bacterium]|nr:glycosyltransferase family 4 protein [Spirochaetales bacterium]